MYVDSQPGIDSVANGKGVFSDAPKSLKEALSGPESHQWQRAVDEELQSMKQANVWGPEVTLPRGQAATPLCFLFTKKLGEDGAMQRYKARLIFCNRDKDTNEGVYAPVVDKSSLRVFLTLVAAMGWILRQADVKTAFLNAPVEGTHYVKLPKDVVNSEASRIRILNKALYGLKHAPKAWNTTFTKWAVSEGNFVQSDFEPCLFFH
jgi:hypothetical protein